LKVTTECSYLMTVVKTVVGVVTTRVVEYVAVVVVGTSEVVYIQLDLQFQTQI